MQGYFSLVLHAHLPFVRHPEHEKSLEENWFFEALSETYIPLLQLLENWERDGIPGRLTLTLTPTLCDMLLDSLLQSRYLRHLQDLLELLEKEIHRTHWEKPFNELAVFYHGRLTEMKQLFIRIQGNLLAQFRMRQQLGQVEIITSAATHAILPLLAQHPPSLRAQLQVARDHYRSCFDREPIGIWLPECAYTNRIEHAVAEAGFKWFILDSHGILHATPRPRYATFAPLLTPNQLAAFGRDFDSAKQVWSRTEGYPGDARYRDFYRDIGFDLDYDYVRPHLATGKRGFTGIKYYRITGHSPDKQIYDRRAALQAAAEHAAHFLSARTIQICELAKAMDRPPLLLCPYDAELFGHWWYEGPEFLDALFRKAAAAQSPFTWVTPTDYLRQHPTLQLATPSQSSWGEDGYLGVWLNPANEWVHRQLSAAQQRMTSLATEFKKTDTLSTRALNQAGRELLLAQSSDWTFILRTGTSPEYARKRVNDHLSRFTLLADQLKAGRIDETRLVELERVDNVFREIRYQYWT